MSVTRDECVNFLKTSRNAIADVRGADWHWQINGVDYPEHQAVKLAEYCLITGQPLTSLATIDGFLDVARRVVALEERLEFLDSYDLPRSQHDHWWRRRG